MFQYAFGYILARKLKTSFILDAYHQRFDLPYFDLPFPHFLMRFPILARIYTRLQHYLKLKHEMRNLDCTQRFPMGDVQDNTDYVGYFQEAKFYMPWREELKGVFAIRKKYRHDFQRRYPSVVRGEKTLVLSIRLGDYREYKLTEYNNASMLLPFDWYISQLLTVPYDDYNVYVISDDIDSVQKEFEQRGYSFHFVRDSVVNQFQLLQHADVAIIPNSTFAWWAAFLNARENARIIAPNYFLGYWVKEEFPVGIQDVNFEWR
jgi:hypothetical protein